MDNVRGATRAARRTRAVARSVLTGGLVLVAAAGCGIVPGLPGGGGSTGGAGAAPAPAAAGSGEPAGGTTDRPRRIASVPGTSLTEPIPLGESKTVVTTDSGVEWEITVTASDTTTSRSSIDDEPCVLVKGTATVITLPGGGESALTDGPVLTPVDSEGTFIRPLLCNPSPADLGLTPVSSIKGEVGDTVEFADTFEMRTEPGERALLAVQDVDPGAYYEDVYFALE